MDTQAVIAEIDADIKKLRTARAALTGVVKASAVAASASKPRKRPRLSKEAQERIGAAQRKRWAAARKAVKTTPVKVAKEAAAPAKKRGMSAAARKRIGDAQRKRWAKVKAEKPAKLAPATKVAKKKAPAKKAAAERKKAPAVKKAAAAKAKKAVAKKAAPATTEAVAP